MIVVRSESRLGWIPSTCRVRSLSPYRRAHDRSLQVVPDSACKGIPVVVRPSMWVLSLRRQIALANGRNPAAIRTGDTVSRKAQGNYPRNPCGWLYSHAGGLGQPSMRILHRRGHPSSFPKWEGGGFQVISTVF